VPAHRDLGLDPELVAAGVVAEGPHAEAGGGSRGVSTEVLAAREQMVFGWAASHGLPVAWVPAGGYTSGGLSLDEVCGLHRLTVEAALHHLGLAA